MSDHVIEDMTMTTAEHPCLTCGHSRSVHVEHEHPWCVDCSRRYWRPYSGCQKFVWSGVTVKGRWP